MTRIKSPIILTFIVILSLLLSACNFNSSEKATTDKGSSGSDSESGGTKQILNLAEIAEIPTLDSAMAHDGVSFTVLNNIKEGLYRLDENNSAILAIANEDKKSEDGRVHTFTLRDAKWSNGDPVTAQDFVFAWQQVFKKHGEYQTMFVTAGIKNAKAIMDGKKSPKELGVKAIDKKTLQVTLEHPNPLLKSLLTFPTFLPKNQKFVNSQGKDYAIDHDKILSDGPFILSSWKHDQSWQYKKNPDYWDAKNVKLKEINVFVVKEVPTKVKLYETNKIDRTILSASYVDQYRDKKDFHSIDQAEIIFLRVNHNNKALGNKNIRRAMNMAIDKKGLVDVILNNGSKELNGLVPHNFSVSPEGKGFRELNGSFNVGTVKEAKKYFAKGLQQIGKDSVKLSIMCSDQEWMTKAAEYLKSQLQENLPGLKIEIKIVPLKQRLELEKSIKYDISLSSWGPDYGDPMTYLGMWVTDGPANRMHYSDPAYDALIKKIRAEKDESKRYQMMLKAERILLGKDAAIIPLFEGKDAILRRASVKKLIHHPFGPNFTYKWTYIKN